MFNYRHGRLFVASITFSTTKQPSFKGLIAFHPLCKWKGINRKQSTRWQHLSRLKASAFFNLQNIFSCYETQQLILGIGTAIWWVTASLQDDFMLPFSFRSSAMITGLLQEGGFMKNQCYKTLVISQLLMHVVLTLLGYHYSCVWHVIISWM